MTVFHQIYNRLGVFWTIVGFTTLSILLSVSGTGLILSYWGDFEDLGPALLLSTILPLVIAPLMSSIQLRLMAKLDRERQEKAQLATELQETLANVKTLKGLIPICASCKKIRDDAGYWQRLEIYIRDHSDATLSHGYCPECAQELQNEINALKQAVSEV